MIRGFDAFGHDIKVNYRGSGSFTTVFGGLVTFCVYALTMVLVIKNVREIFLMQDPTLSEYSEPLTLDDRAEWVPLNHKDFNFVLGVVTRVYGNKTDDSEDTKPYPLPREVGTWFVE